MHISDHASSSHTGKIRRTNEDAYLDAPPLFVVADGMGGARAGEVASRLAIDTFLELRPVPGEDGEERLRRTILESNRRVLERSQTDPSAAGMGSTVTAALLDGDRVVVGHVGDSRAYLLRDAVLQQLSHDHSLVAELERAGRHHARGGRGAPAALGDHARARRDPRPRGRHGVAAGARR